MQATVGTPALELDSLLVFSDRTAVGRIDEVFGPVGEPFYVVRYNETREINREKVGTVGVCRVMLCVCAVLMLVMMMLLLLCRLWRVLRSSMCLR